MDSRATQSHAHEHHGLQVAHGAEEHHDEHEKKSVLKKVKAKAKKIKDTITKHGHHDHDQEHGHGYQSGDQHIPDDHDLDEEDDGDVQDPEIHGAPIYDSAAVRNVTPGQVKTSGAGAKFGGATVMGEPTHEPRVVVSPTTETNHSRFNDPARTFVRDENKAVQPRERPMELEEDARAPESRVGPYASANYETKVTDPTRAGGAEIDITPGEKSFARMAVHNEPKPQHTLATSHGLHVPQTQYPSGVKPGLTPQFPLATSHDQNLPQFSSATKTQYPSAGSHDQFTPELPTGHIPQHSFPASHDQTLPQYSSATQTEYPSARSHDQFTPELPTEPRSQHSIDTSHNQNLPQHSRTQYPSGRSHDQFTPQSNQEQSNQSNSYTDTIYLATAAMADKATAAKNAVASKLGYGQNENETRSGENPSNQGSSYTEKMSSATSAVADKANTAKNAVASKLGYGENENVNETRIGENQSNQSSYTDKVYLATAAIGDKAATAKNAVASKLGYGENKSENVNETRTGEYPANQSSSYTEKISSATPSIADKATADKNVVASKLGYGQNENVNESRISETPQNQHSSYTEKISSATSSIADKAVSAKNAVASKLGFGEKAERNLANTPATSANSATSATESPAEYGKKIAVSLTEKLAPVYGKAAGEGSALKTQTKTESGGLEQDKGVSMKDYLAEKLRPGEDDVALSEMISENLYKKEGGEYDEGEGENVNVRKLVSDAVHKRGDVDEGREVSRPRGKVTESEQVRRRLGGWDDEGEKEGEKSVAGKVKDVVGSWFGASGENQNQSTQGSGVVSRNSGVEVEHVNEGVGERRLHELTN